MPDFSAPAGKVVVVGDSRPGDYLEFFLEDSRHVPKIVFEAIAAERPSCVVHAGDIAVYGAHASFWQGWRGWDRDVAPLAAAGIPVYPALGNHEYRGFTRDPLSHYFARFAHLGGRLYYTLLSGARLFVFLDSNFDRLGGEKAAAQDRWLSGVLERARVESAVRHVIPVVHHPPFTNVSRRYLVFESREVQRRWVPAFLDHPKVAMVVSGHVHAYEHIVEGGKRFIVTGGGGSPRFRLRTRGARLRRDLWPGREALRPFHYLRLEDEPSGASRVEVVCWRPGGGWYVGDAFTLDAASAAGAS